MIEQIQKFEINIMITFDILYDSDPLSYTNIERLFGELIPFERIETVWYTLDEIIKHNEYMIKHKHHIPQVMSYKLLIISIKEMIKLEYHEEFNISLDKCDIKIKTINGYLEEE